MPKAPSEFVAYVLDQLADLGSVTSRHMFGGTGLYFDGVFIAIVYQDALYLKADDENRAMFDEAGCEPFIFESRDGETIETSYRSVPPEILESADDLGKWARSAQEAALRKKARSPEKRSSRSKSTTAPSKTKPKSPRRGRRT
jgi:DNA transformation protein